MKTFDEWMENYGISHQNKINIMIHKLCVPAIMFSVIGLLMCIPVPSIISKVKHFNWATLAALMSLIFYFRLHRKMFIGMLLMIIVMYTLNSFIIKSYLLKVSISIFILSWLAQFIGHKIEGKKPSFIEDLSFLLIGPLWVLRFFYKRIGISV